MFELKPEWPLSESTKLVASRDKVFNMAPRDSDDALVCCIQNTVEDRIMDSGASFHAIYCKEELERFKLCSGKVCLANEKTLNIAGVRDVVLKASFGTSWTLKDVRYISSLKRRLISVGQLNEEGYHISTLLSSGWVEVKESFLHNVSEDKETAEIRARLRIPEEEWRGKDTSLTHLKLRNTKSHQVIRSRDITFMDSIHGARSATDSSSLTKLIQKSQVVLVDIPENLAENDNIVAEHGLSSEITQARMENGEPESYSEALSSKESVQWKKAINEEMVSLEKNQTCSLVRLPAGKKASQSLWMFMVKEEQDGQTKVQG
ncbi:retrovirus-related pol polyprotein from transposon TNT 1-94 [Tanacetum coccineum]